MKQHKVKPIPALLQRPTKSYPKSPNLLPGWVLTEANPMRLAADSDFGDGGGHCPRDDDDGGAGDCAHDRAAAASPKSPLLQLFL